MNFHETGIGHRFYEQQLPELTSQISQLNAALRSLTTAMQQPDQALILPVEASPDFLKDLYHGNYEPDMEQSPLRAEQLTAAVVKSQRLLRERVSADAWALIDECHRSSTSVRCTMRSGRLKLDFARPCGCLRRGSPHRRQKEAAHKTVIWR